MPNKIDFNALPAGFPLESDAILGQLQSNLQGVDLALGQMVGLPPNGWAYVISGCVVSAGTMTDGWILLNNGGTYEVLFFEGGTVGSLYVISQTAVQKANEDGTLVDRIITRKCTFGSGVGAFQFQDVYKPATGFDAAKALAIIGKAQGDWANWVLLSGFDAVSGGAGGIGEGIALYNGKLVTAAAYTSAVSSGSPVYLQSDGTWTTGTPVGVAVTFNPYSDKHLRCFYRKRLHPIGSLLPMKSAVAELTTFFPGTGDGIGEWLGWALANGNNSTLNLSSAISGVSFIQRMS